MREFVTVKLQCPVCGMEFVADEVHGALPVGHDTDFRPLFDGPDPIRTHMHACPGCHYSAYRGGFDTEPSDEDELIEPFDDDERCLARPFVTVPDEFDAEDLRRYSRSGELAAGLVEPGREPFGAMRYLLAARIHEFLREGEPLVAAHYLLRAAWCARAEGHGLVERAALRELLLRLSNVLEQRESIASSTLPRLLYLAGETARRTGDFGRAVDAFAQVEKEVDFDDAEGLQLAHLARRQGQLASVQSDVNASLPTEWPGQRRADADEDDDLDDDEPLGFDDEDDDGENSVN